MILIIAILLQTYIGFLFGWEFGYKKKEKEIANKKCKGNCSCS